MGVVGRPMLGALVLVPPLFAGCIIDEPDLFCMSDPGDLQGRFAFTPVNQTLTPGILTQFQAA